MKRDDTSRQPRRSPRGAGPAGARADRERRAEPSLRPDGTVRVEHGTRVHFTARCARCGTEHELARAPRGEFVCAACESGVAAPTPSRETDTEYTCPSCGRVTWVPRSAVETYGAAMVCADCMRGVERSRPDRVGGAVLDRDGGVLKKRLRRAP